MPRIEAEDLAREIRKRVLKLTNKWPLGITQTCINPSAQYDRGRLEAYQDTVKLINMLISIEESKCTQ